MSALLKQPALHFRPMDEDDIVTVMAIESRAYDYPWTEGIFRDCLRISYCCRMCVEDNTVVGYAIMSVGAGESHILNICVKPESRRRGIGRSLLTHMLELAHARAVDIVTLEARVSNHIAIKLYQDMGFNEVGIRKAYYPAANKGIEDAIILARTL